MRSMIPFQTHELWRDFDRLFFGENTLPKRDDFTPSADIYETETGYEVAVELPGVKKDDIGIDLKEGVLTISGERKNERDSDSGELVRRERSHGKFQRSWTLPKESDPEKIAATYEAGVLTLSIPKRPEVQPKQIEIKVN